MQTLRLQVLSWENGMPLFEVQISIIACVLAVAAFFCASSLAGMFSIVFAWWRSTPKHHKKGVPNAYQGEEKQFVAILMLFPQLPRPPDLISTLGQCLPLMFGHKADCCCCCCFRSEDVTRRLSFHLLSFDDQEDDSHPNADALHTAITHSHNGEGSHRGSEEDASTAEATQGAATVMKTSKKSRLSLLLGRRKPRRHVVKPVAVTEAPVTKVDTNSVGDGSNFMNNSSSTASTFVPPLPLSLSEKVERCWERMVQQKALQLVEGPMPVMCKNAWDVHYMKVFVPKAEERGEKCRCGGILVRIRSETGNPSELLHLALTSGLLCINDTPQNEECSTNSNKWSSLPETVSECSLFKLLFRYVVSEIFRYVDLFVIPTLHLVQSIAALMVRCISHVFFFFSSNAYAPRHDRAVNANSGPCQMQLLLLPPHSKDLLQRVAERLNEWIGPTREDVLKVCINDVEAALLLGTAGRLVQHHHQQHSLGESCETGKGIEYNAQKYPFFRVLLFSCRWMKHRYRVCHSSASCEASLDGGVATYPYPEIPTNGEAAMEWTSEEAVVDRVLSCVEHRVCSAAAGLPLVSVPITPSSSRDVKKENSYSFSGQHIQALYCIHTAPTLMQCERKQFALTLTECTDTICTTFWLVLPKEASMHGIPCVDEVSGEFMKELSVMAKAVLGIETVEAGNSVKMP